MASRLSDSALLMRLRTRQLLLVARLGHERHLGRAAEALGISQPAATKLLQRRWAWRCSRGSRAAWNPRRAAKC